MINNTYHNHSIYKIAKAHFSFYLYTRDNDIRLCDGIFINLQHINLYFAPFTGDSEEEMNHEPSSNAEEERESAG